MKKKDILNLLNTYEETYPDYLTIESFLSEYAYWHYKPEKDLDSQISAICYDMYFASAGRLGVYQAFPWHY